MIRIERLEGPGAAATVEPLLREYVPWVAAEAATLGIDFDDTDAVVEQHHAAFRAELPNLVEGRAGCWWPGSTASRSASAP